MKFQVSDPARIVILKVLVIHNSQLQEANILP
ncbi:hypothetical protein FOQG_18761, partial [Fusarium oxysporum f. sp. raphani 54005]